MNVFCIHNRPFNKPCGVCGRVGDHGVSDHSKEIAREMLIERTLIKHSYDEAKVLMKLTTMQSIAELTGVSPTTLRKMQKEIEGELCKSGIPELKKT